MKKSRWSHISRTQWTSVPQKAHKDPAAPLLSIYPRVLNICWHMSAYVFRTALFLVAKKKWKLKYSSTNKQCPATSKIQL